MCFRFLPNFEWREGFFQCTDIYILHFWKFEVIYQKNGTVTHIVLYNFMYSTLRLWGSIQLPWGTEQLEDGLESDVFFSTNNN